MKNKLNTLAPDHTAEDAAKDPIAWRLVRWIYGAFYLLSGLQIALVLAAVLPPPDFKLGAESAAFQTALANTGFFLPALSLTYVVSGGALLFYRTAPLGVVVLAPVMVMIFLTNTLLDTAWLWGTAHTIVLIALAWHFRAAYHPLWNYTAVVPPADA